MLDAAGSLAPDQVRSFLAQLLAALHHVHSLRMIHRDLKPANVLISPARRSPASPYGTLRLCDFGLARVNLVDEPLPRPSHAPRRTRREMEAGTETATLPLAAAAAAPGPPSPTPPAARGLSSRVLASFRRPPARPAPLRHEMTFTGVTTRWYRAPEVILRQPYTGKVDLWAAGCIAKEMLELTRLGPRMGALFPGERCWPSGWGAAGAAEDESDDEEEEEAEAARMDQLSVILRVLGAPTADELAWATDAGRALVRASCEDGRWARGSADERRDELSRRVEGRLPGAGADEISLLCGLLDLVPSRRLSALDALRHAYFSALPAAQAPHVAPERSLVSRAAIDAAFAFEGREAECDEIRQMIVDDIHRMAMADGSAVLIETAPPERAGVGPMLEACLRSALPCAPQA
jgi:serine/threonine protein kinase